MMKIIIRFRNISSIIDCVTCSKCRMHAKLEVFGIATMLKIIFTSSTEELKKSMSRNELVAFINLFAKLSKSVNNLELIDKKIKLAHHNLKFKKLKCICTVSIIAIIITFAIILVIIKKYVIMLTILQLYQSQKKWKRTTKKMN